MLLTSNFMKKFTLFALVLLLSYSYLHAELPAYQIFNSKGKQVSFNKMAKDLTNSDIILFGEFHGNPIIHWLQYELTKFLHAQSDSNLILAAEMFESDNQLIFNEFLNGKISEVRFEDEMRLWRNYRTDYKPLVMFAKENNLKFIASNIPRRYASMVAAHGFESLEALSEEAHRFIAPLPIAYDPELPGYKRMLDMGGMGKTQVNQNLPKAQAIKDATMAHFILQGMAPGKQIIHFNGTYHSDFFEGIYWYLKKANPELNVKTIATVIQEEVKNLSEESLGRADYIIAVPESMTRTF